MVAINQNATSAEKYAGNRRVRKTVTNGGLAGNIPNGTTDSCWFGWQSMEERNPFGGSGSTDTPTKQYIWGTYVDECVQINLLVTAGPQQLAAGVYYPLQDTLYRAMALTNSSGSVVEAYDTDAYGNTLIFTGPGADNTWFTDDDTQSSYGANNIIYCGYRYDAETGNYYVRNRYYSPTLGRWLTRDPIGYRGGINLYGYVENGPVGWASRRRGQTAQVDLFHGGKGLAQEAVNGDFGRRAVEPYTTIKTHGKASRAGVHSKKCRDDIPSKIAIIHVYKHGHFNTYIYLLENKEGKPLHGSGYGVEEIITPPTTASTSEGEFKATNYGEVADEVGYKVNPGHNLNKSSVSYQTFVVRFHGKYYHLTTEHKLVIVVKHGVVTDIQDIVVRP